VSGGLIPGRAKSLSSSPKFPDLLWDLPSLLNTEYEGIFPFR